MSALNPRRAVTRLPFDDAADIMTSSGNLIATGAQWQCDNRPRNDTPLRPRWPRTPLQLATERELNDFLKDVEKRAFKRALYHVRNEESALDIVQDSMMKLSIHYGDKTTDELQPLFQRILSNTILDWFRRQKTHNTLISNFSDLEAGTDEDGDFNLLETLMSHDEQHGVDTGEVHLERQQVLSAIEKEIEDLPERQREAFLLRYWEDMDVAETAQAMGCTAGSVKTHCFRAVQALAKALTAKGIRL